MGFRQAKRQKAKKKKYQVRQRNKKKKEKMVEKLQSINIKLHAY